MVAEDFIQYWLNVSKNEKHYQQPEEAMMGLVEVESGDANIDWLAPLTSVKDAIASHLYGLERAPPH